MMEIDNDLRDIQDITDTILDVLTVNDEHDEDFIANLTIVIEDIAGLAGDALNMLRAEGIIK